MLSKKSNKSWAETFTTVCHIIKYVLFILTQKDFTAADFTELFFEHVECCFEISRSIVTDKDSHITSEF